MSIVLFAYNFPHRKTQDFMMRLFLSRVPVDQVIAADRVELRIPPSSVRTRVRSGGLVHPRDVADRLDWPYVVLPHDSPEVVELLDGLDSRIGIVAGARILPEPVIDAFSVGIVNFHPGLIPECRGLDALLWSIRKDVRLGVTAHLIDRRVDAGRVVERREIAIRADDTAFDLQQRLYDTQLEMLPDTVAMLRSETQALEEAIPEGVESEYNRKMTPDLERETMAMLPDYVRRWSTRSES